MTITVKVVAHSCWPGLPDLITLQMRYPRMIHAEFMTHRVFSRNASSSRAIPVERMIQDVIDDPAMPVRWGANQPGMQDAGDHDALVSCYPLLDGEVHYDERDPASAWLLARDYAVTAARGFVKAGYHKQVANRLLEPFGHISVVCTATDWENFFALRCHPDADPTMRALAEAMRDAIAESVPEEPMDGAWHLPYIPTDLASNNVRRGEFTWEQIAMISAARCARVSYLNHDGSNPDLTKDIALAQRLLESKHMSPFEHQGFPGAGAPKTLWGNFRGWVQHRKLVEKV